MHFRCGLKDISWTPNFLVTEWIDGQRSEFPSLWLRDNCPANRDPQNGQRLIDVTDLPHDPRIHAATVHDDAILVEWEDESDPATFDLQWLARNGLCDQGLMVNLTTKLWLEGAELEASRDFAWLAFPEFRDDHQVRLDWMIRLIHEGVAFLTDVPCLEQAVLEPVQLIGTIQETNYGRVFDVRFLPRPENLADSDRGLGLHTDNPYRDPVPGFQVLHILAASPEGGESILADGFAIAEFLRREEPELFRKLTQTPVPFRFSSKDADLSSRKSLIQVAIDGSIQAVHYNNRSIAPLQLSPPEVGPFYRAYRRFAELLRDEKFQLRLHMGDGDLVAFDNHRILHGRTGFSSSKYPRHLQGCYLTRDSVFSKAAILRRQLLEAELFT